VVVAGLGGQGAIKASDILADAAFRAGHDVKKAEVHGMSQRGGSVTSDVRFGPEVLSPMIPRGQADFMVVLAQSEVEVNRFNLKAGGVLIPPDAVDEALLQNKKSLNVALLGALAARLDLAEEHWLAAIRAALPERLHQLNERAFQLGRESAR
jgi:indolepyruvate ferredoxin oxidoreductase beta subunit